LLLLILTILVPSSIYTIFSIFKPPVLPSSKFRIYKTNDEYSNTAMISNDTLKIQFFTNEVEYGNLTSQPIYEIEIVFPKTSDCDLLNIQQWIDLLNTTFNNTNVNIPSYTNLGKILQCDWSFFPYQYDFLSNKTVYIKSAIIKIINNSNYCIKFLARWSLLQLFGKAMTGDTLNPVDQQGSRISVMSQNRIKLNKNTKNDINNNRLLPKNNKSLYMQCDEETIYGILDTQIQQFFPFYATTDGNIQLPIACMKRSAELIILPKQTFIGLYDGYSNPNLWSFGVKFRSVETWIYINLDTADAHPIHFHLTSGYMLPSSTYNSSKYSNLSNQQTYSRDIYQVGPNQTVSFNLTWPYYPSYKTTKSPKIRCLGGVIHCHFLPHNDVNSMMVQYFVDE